MALHFRSTFTPLDLRSPSKLHCIYERFITCFKPKEEQMTSQRAFGKSASLSNHSVYSVMAIAEAAISEKAQKIEQVAEESLFTITSLDEGGKKSWHSARVLSVKELAPGVKNITIDAEVSREMVALEDAYNAPGRMAQVKVAEGEAVKVVASSPCFTMKANEAVLYKVRGDIPAGTTKQPQYFLSVKHPLDLLVYEAETPSIYSLKEGDELELGPFDLYGLDLRPILFLARYPTILFFASGKGIAVAKSIIEAKDADVGSMSLGMREEIRLFYWSPEPSKVLFKDHFQKWENKKLKVRAAVGSAGGQEWDRHVGSFTSLWDEDDIEYDPSTTGVIVCVESGSRTEVEQLLADAEIPEKQVLIWEP